MDERIGNTMPGSEFLKKATYKVAKEIFSSEIILKMLMNNPTNTEITLTAKDTAYSYTVMVIDHYPSMLFTGKKTGGHDIVCALTIGPANNLTKFSLWHLTVKHHISTLNKVVLTDLKHINSVLVADSINSKKFTTMDTLALMYKPDSNVVCSIYGQDINVATFSEEIVDKMTFNVKQVKRPINCSESKLSIPNKNNINIFPYIDEHMKYPGFENLYGVLLTIFAESVKTKCFDRFDVKPKLTLLWFKTSYQCHEFDDNFFFAIFTLSESCNTKGMNGSTMLSIDESQARIKGFKDFFFNSAVKYAKHLYKVNKKKNKSVDTPIKIIKDYIQKDKSKSKEE